MSDGHHHYEGDFARAGFSTLLALIMPDALVGIVGKIVFAVVMTVITTCVSRVMNILWDKVKK